MNEVERLGATIESHQPGDERESTSRSIFLTELTRLERPFDELADLTHVTASGIVISTRGVILHKHRRLLRWMQPGGHIEAGETPAEAVVRECSEETGLAVRHASGGIKLIHVDVHPAANGHIHLDVRYLMVAPEEDPAPPPEESQDVKWFSWEEASELADDALTGALRSARRVFDTSIRNPGASERTRDG